jgi:hypothetical protein
MYRVVLEYGCTPGWVCVRDICGHDEEAVVGTDSEAAIALLDGLLVDVPGAALAPGAAAELTVADRDRVLAAVFEATLGRRVESTVRCVQCEEPFDLDFLLSDLIASLHAPAPADVVREPNGVFRLPDGRRFVLPRGVDERAVAAEPAEQAERSMLRRCMIEGSAGDDPDAVTNAMRAVAPLVDLEVDARCPECGRNQSVHFELQQYFLSRLLAERRQRALEIHRLAVAYGWSWREIAELPRARRRLHVELIERELPVR